MAKWIAGTPLGIITLFQLWIIFFRSGSDLSLIDQLSLLPFAILMFIGPLIWSFIIFFQDDNPLISLTVTIPSALIYLAAFYIEFLKPYQGGGASMVYAVAWVYAFMASGLCFLIYKLVNKTKSRNLTNH
jgi:ABC-type Na+ efflux pump permease subunit